MNLLAKLFGKKTDGLPDEAVEPVESTVSPSVADPSAISNGLEAFREQAEHVGMRDVHLQGLYVDNVVFPGFEVTAEDHVVDVGCGNGVAVDFCVHAGASIDFVDIDKAAVDAAETRLLGKLREGQYAKGHVSDANPLPLASELASRVICTEVLEHVDDTAAFLSELVRVGKPGAQYFITVPAPQSENAQRNIAPPVYFEKPNHIRIISNDEFRAMVEDAGLVVEQFEVSGFYWSVWWIFFWVCNHDLSDRWHPLLVSWAQTWNLLMDNPRALEIKGVLDEVLPKQQMILARKPA